MDQPRVRTCLIIGATGGFGGNAAAALARRGWKVKDLARDPATARAKAPAAPVEFIAGDAMVREDVIAAATGADLIVHAANPPGYRNWAGTVLPMIENTITAARLSGARIVLPGNVYNYAPGAGAAIAEDAAQAPATRKGAIRVAMERALEQASHQGVKSLILRAGDFYGPGQPFGLFSWLLVRSGGRPLALMRPGPADVRHAFAYLPDLAETLARLAEREAELPVFARFHFAGDFVTPAQLAAAVRGALSRPRLPVVPFPWPLVRVGGLADETLRELWEMRYLWRTEIGLDGSRLAAFVGEVPATPLEAAVGAALADLPKDRAASASRSREAPWNTSDLARPA
ncbi:MAG TPA: NAD-dependent epimerase/dehydratase family protein [Caulobacteraceae bacterium]|nr:NAD-dependent epimerase/dehydratase family protein [Caulobacteraceae bacterium]